MGKNGLFWLLFKGLSFLVVGVIFYTLFGMRGTCPASIVTWMVTKIIPLLVLYYVFDVIARKIQGSMVE